MKKIYSVIFVILVVLFTRSNANNIDLMAKLPESGNFNELLYGISRQDDSGIKAYSTEELGKLGVKSYAMIPNILVLLNKEEKSWVKIAALNALVEIVPPKYHKIRVEKPYSVMSVEKVVERMKIALSDDDVNVRGVAAASILLLDMNESDAYPLFEEAIKTKHPILFNDKVFNDVFEECKKVTHHFPSAVEGGCNPKDILQERLEEKYKWMCDKLPLNEKEKAELLNELSSNDLGVRANAAFKFYRTPVNEKERWYPSSIQRSG